MDGPGGSSPREHPLKLLEDQIGEALRDSEARGELALAPSYGRPLDFGDGYAQTPLELRMPMKILKDAGVMPPEVEMLRQLAELRAASERETDPQAQRALAQRASELSQFIALRLERLRGGSI